MSNTQNSIPPIYLLEVLDTPDGLVDACEPFRKLDLAVEAAMAQLLKAYPAVTPDVEVSQDSDNELEGISFVNEDLAQLAFISVYHLDREIDSAQNTAITAACNGDISQLQAQLNRIIRVK